MANNRSCIIHHRDSWHSQNTNTYLCTYVKKYKHYVYRRALVETCKLWVSNANKKEQMHVIRDIRTRREYVLPRITTFTNSSKNSNQLLNWFGRNHFSLLKRKLDILQRSCRVIATWMFIIDFYSSKMAAVSVWRWCSVCLHKDNGWYIWWTWRTNWAWV